MNRRQFLRGLIALGVIGHEIDIDRLLWVPGEKTIFVPTLAQINFFNNKSPYSISLYGIPYHVDYGITGEWLGIKRDEF